MLNLNIDMDGVVCDLHTPWYKWINQKYNDNLTVDKVTEWHLEKFTKAGKECYDFLSIPGVFLDLEPLPHSLETLTALHEQGHKIKFVTSVPMNSETAEDEKKEWLIHHLPFFNPDTDFVNSHDKSEVSGDILLDDRAKWLWEFKGLLAVGIAYPYNTEWTGYRLNSWTEFPDIVDYINRNK